jgi:hypothetical protein
VFSENIYSLCALKKFSIFSRYGYIYNYIYPYIENFEQLLF